MGKSVAIILVNWNGYHHTVKCIRSLRKLEYQPFSIIVVDNASEDGSLTRLKAEFQEVVFLSNNENLGFTGGNNRGIQFALEKGFKQILLLNNDTEVSPTFLSKLLEFKAKNQAQKLGILQPLILYSHNRSKIWNAGGGFHKFLGISSTRGEGATLKERMPIGNEEIDWATGCCMLIEAAAIRDVGLLNDAYFAYFEDVDWSLRFRARGYLNFLVTDAVIYHDAGASSKKKHDEGTLHPVVLYYTSRNQLFQLKSHVGLPFAFIAWPFQLGKLAAWMFYFAVRLRFKKLKAVWLGVVDGILLNPASPIPFDRRRRTLTI